jgi:hypothetical protein
MPMSPTQLTLRELKKMGYFPAVVEHWNPFARIRQDLFGFIDVIGVKRDETIAVQATSLSNMSARVKKLTNHDNIGYVREANWRIEVWGFYKEKNKWKFRRVDLS